MGTSLQNNRKKDSSGEFNKSLEQKILTKYRAETEIVD